MAANRGVIQTIFEEYDTENDIWYYTFCLTIEYNMPIPSIDISCSEMLSSSIALTYLYTWTDIVPLVQISGEIWQRLLSLLFMRYFVSPRPRIALPALLEKCLSSSAFALLDTRKSLKPLRRRGEYFRVAKLWLFQIAIIIYTFKTIQNLKSPCYWLIPISYWPVFGINQVVDCIVCLTFVLSVCSTTKPSSLTSHIVNLPHGWYPRTRRFFCDSGIFA